MSGSLIAAVASIAVAVLAFALNRYSQQQLERHRALLERVNSQLRELYGPLNTMVNVNEYLWEEMHGPVIPNRSQRKANHLLGENQRTQWELWLNQALMPTNLKMRDKILLHADLILEEKMPEPLLVFCAHVASYEVHLSIDGTHEPNRSVLVRHPGDPYTEYVRRSYAKLKEDQARLLNITAPQRRAKRRGYFLRSQD